MGINLTDQTRPPNEWIGVSNLLFERPNRTVKYIYDGDLLIVRELAEWNDIHPRLMRNIFPVIVFCLAIVFNFMLIFMSLAKKRRSFHYKSRCIIAHLAFANIVISSGFLIYTFLIDIFYDVDSFDTLIEINAYSTFARILPVAKTIVHNMMIENFTIIQSLILFLLAADRYASLFPQYSPFVKKKVSFYCLTIFPYICGIVLFDHTFASEILGSNAATVLSLCVLTIPTLLGVVFTVCSSVRLIQERSISNPNHDISCTLTLLAILLVQMFERCGLFLELLHSNYMIEIVVGSKKGDIVLKSLLENYYHVAHFLMLLSPLYQSLAVLLLTKYYRHSIFLIGEHILRLLTCRRRPKLDYSSETMRSIIEQNQRLSRFGYSRS